MATVGVAARVKERMGAGRFAIGPEASVKASVGRPAKRLRRSSLRLSVAQEEAPAFVPSNITVVILVYCKGPERREAGLFSELPRRVLLGNSSLRWGCSRSGLFFYFLLVVLVAQAASRQRHQ